MAASSRWKRVIIVEVSSKWRTLIYDQSFVRVCCAPNLTEPAFADGRSERIQDLWAVIRKQLKLGASTRQIRLLFHKVRRLSYTVAFKTVVHRCGEHLDPLRDGS